MVHRIVGIALAANVLASCHVASTVEVVRPGEIKHEILRDTITIERPSVVITDTGQLRFVEALLCATKDTIAQTATTERTLEPNLAAFVVGIAATAAGGVSFTVGAFSKDPAGSPALYAGGLGLLLGLPLSIGPWIGRTKELVAGRSLAPIEQAGQPEPCGDRPIKARAATVSINNADVRGKVDANGVFSISPFAMLDAYTPDKLRPLEVTAILETDAPGGATKTIAQVVEVGHLLEQAPKYLKAIEHHDSRIEPFRMVPGITPGTLRVSVTSTSDGPAIRIVLPLENKGPGEAWAVRGQIDTPVRAIDGRMIYYGHIAVGEVASRELLIPISSDIASMMRNTTIQVTVVLRDGYGTAPENPVKFNGPVLVDLPR